MKKKSSFFSLKLILFSVSVILLSVNARAQVVINEIVASSEQSLADADGEYPDWIELYNASGNTINLLDYGISDDPEEPFQYTLSDIEIAPGEYYMLFASDKDREGYTAFWETVVREGDETSYIVPSSAVSSDWVQPGFNDSNWETGPFGLGYGDNDDATTVNSGVLSIFSRTKFTVDDATSINRMMLHLDFDDGYIAYLNGTELHRENMDGEAPLPYNSTTNTYTEPKLAFGEQLEGIQLSDYTGLLVDGENVLAIQLHNNSTTSSDLTLIPFLSLGYSSSPPESRGIAPETNLQSTLVAYPHLNFKLSASGETVTLTAPDSSLADMISYPELNSDESYGRSIENDSTWYIFTQTTPLAANTTQGYTARLSDPELDKPGGFYDAPIQLSLADTTMGNTVYFTVDGSVPTTSSLKFGVDSREVSQTFVLRFRTMEERKLPSNVITETYFIGTEEKHSLPVVSLATKPDNLWSEESGIYVRGRNGIDANCSNGPANWNQDWEIPINIELYEEDGSVGFNSGAGAKIFGGCSRGNAQKSLSVFFRGEYGNSALEYQLFQEKDIDEFQAFILRNSGNDFNYSQFRDGLMKTLIENTEIDYQAYRPAVVYINGEYWGIHNIREKVNEHFIASNSNADADQIDMLENNNSVIHGSSENYEEFLDLLSSANMNDPEEYQSVENMIDIDNYVDYMAAEIYYANTDWPGNNIKYWRNKLTNGRWRWIIYDTDFGFNLYDYNAHENTLTFALDASHSDPYYWPNPSWSTFVFRRLVQSEIFAQKFVNRMADLMNTDFDEPRINNVIDSLSVKIAPEMPRHFEKWGGSVNGWNEEISALRSFANNRNTNMEGFLKSYFGLSNPEDITVDVNNSEYGSVQVNRIIPVEYPWNGRYFTGMPVKITALPKPGYAFTGWNGASVSKENGIEVIAGSSVIANFEQISSAGTPIVINEFMYNAPDEEDPGDWIELYNSADYEIDISGWQIKDDDNGHSFEFPSGIILTEGSYLVVADDLEDFNSLYNDIQNTYGELGFGLGGGGDQIRLFNNQGILVDSLQYKDEDPWPSGADGTGLTMELKNPGLDNSQPENWKASDVNAGTPGFSNSVFVSNEETKELPSAISLSQNYPNPFNPTTHIRFELPNSVKIKLTVFDMLGRKVAVLDEETRTAGVYNMRWDASQHASGLYIYRLEAGQKVLTRKMLLIK